MAYEISCQKMSNKRLYIINTDRIKQIKIGYI